MKTLVTCGYNPDLDGLSSSLGLAQLLMEEGKNVVVGFEGQFQLDAQFYLEKLKITPNVIPDIFDCAVLVDVSSINYVPRVLRNHPERVIQVFDHRSYHTIDQDFPNVNNIVSQPVGACASIVADSLLRNNVTPQEVEATLMHSAIFSSTLNLKANVSTELDFDMVDWLVSLYPIQASIVDEMWKFRTRLNPDQLQFTLINDIDRDTQIYDMTIGIAQIETLNGKSVIEEQNVHLLSILNDIKRLEGLDYLFLTIPSIQEEFNYILTVDDPSTKLVLDFMSDDIQRTFQSEDEPNLTISITNKLLLRKEIKPKILNFSSS